RKKREEERPVEEVQVVGERPNPNRKDAFSQKAEFRQLLKYIQSYSRIGPWLLDGCGIDGLECVVVYGKKDAKKDTQSNFKQCMATCLQVNYGETYEWAERFSPVSLQGLLTNEAAELLQDHAQKQANRNAWSYDKETFETGRRQLGVVKFFSRFNAAAAVAGAGAAGFQAGALGYCAADCLNE
ncbi:hypothetical protein, partial [Microbulbifer sp. 2205BS26-8]|uniref:hypothetical protein n=1 Tax=Microbulbifer sp. 2205BS26-8 TaxID=3064386 RepID=UPI00273F8632